MSDDVVELSGSGRIQRMTIASVALLAVIAAVVLFHHMHELCLRHGEDGFAAVLIPLAVDGTIVTASMSILLTNRPAPAAVLWPGPCSSPAAWPAWAPTSPSRNRR
ncbi:DUF2637 domain-containing protein [Streptosporangiaceae bacterium NEAU-GS5]|nr:DUF2637 domain-containing protein [Streptosporangiaceae bacterium NEAU-GS5]